MDITGFTKQQGQFLNADDVKNMPQAYFTITREPVVVEAEFKGKKSQRLHAPGNFNSDARVFNMSKTNARTVAEKLGNDTSKWIGHKLYLETYRTKTSEGALVDALNVKEVQ